MFKNLDKEKLSKIVFLLSGFVVLLIASFGIGFYSAMSKSF